jgi:chemotaxis family two-component system response regulator Rcp1
VLNRLHVVADGTEALRFLRREGPHGAAPRPDLILLDLNLPGMDGREVLRQVKQDDELRRIPVVVMTRSDAERDVIATYDTGANSYVTKPVGLDEFTRVVQSVQEFWFSIVTLPPE